MTLLTVTMANDRLAHSSERAPHIDETTTVRK